MQPSVGGRVKRCTQSVRLSVRPETSVKIYWTTIPAFEWNDSDTNS